MRRLGVDRPPPVARLDDPVRWKSLPPLVSVFLLTFFIPDRIDFEIAALQFTPQRAVGLLLLPTLLLTERIRWALPDLLAVAYVAAGFVSFAMSSGLGRATEVTGRLSLDIFLPYMVARWIAQDPGRFKATLGLMFGCLSAFAVLAIVESFAGVNVWLEVWSLVGDVGNTTHPETRMGLGRAKVWTDHPIMLGLVYAAWLGMALYAIKDRWLRPVKHPGPILVLFIVAIVLSFSSAAWVAGVIVLGLFAWDRLAGRAPAVKWQIAWVGLPLAYWLLETISGRPLLRLAMMKLHISSGNAWQYRWRLIRRVKEAMPGYEWFGHGLERPTGFVDGFASSIDNHFLLVILQRGRVGLWLWVAWMVSVCLFAGKAVWFGRDSDAARWARAVCFSVIALALSQFSVALFSAGGRMFWFISGLAVGLAVLARSASDASAESDDSPQRDASFPHHASAQPPALPQPFSK